ncbi:MAG TPA: SpoIIE family protein phosphatase [Terriglobales bacterium]|nr:SpoIIE family protein phosphatase [Terriglobales bacterium]
MAFLRNTAAGPAPATPKPPVRPSVEGHSVDAYYQAARTGGDFFEFAITPSGRLLVVLLDVAGERDEAFVVESAVQARMRDLGPELFSDPEGNDAISLSSLTMELNRTIIEAAGGVRCAPGFLACYEPSLGALWYVNAGHTPGLVRDPVHVATLGASGVPMGLFSHAVHDAQLSVLQPASAMLLVSRGTVEAAGRLEAGLERAREVLQSSALHSAGDLCKAALAGTLGKPSRTDSAIHALKRLAGPQENDRTAVAVIRR